MLRAPLAALLQLAGKKPRGSFHVGCHLSIQRPHQAVLVQCCERQKVQHATALLRGTHVASALCKPFPKN
jgi:hypothetical protein